MRFSLFTLNATLALAAVLVWLVVQHGLLGSLFLLPLLSTLVICLWLARCNRRRWAWSLLAAYLGLWGVTAVFGTAAADQWVRSRINGPIEFLDADPERKGGVEPEPPWCYVGNLSAPCPFVVAVDVAVQGEHQGVRERAYVSWFPGCVCLVHNEHIWESG